MPASDFTQPTVTDGTLVDHVVTPGTIHNKNWWDNTLFAWILGMVKNSSYPETTPADLIEQVLQGTLNPPLYVESEDTHTQSGSSDSTRAYIKASHYALDLGTAQFYGGEWAEFGVGGNCIVAAFSNADYYKHIALGLYESGGVLTLTTTESAESATEVGLADPPTYSGRWKHLANIIVQNDGTTGTAGKILTIAQADISCVGLTVPLWAPQVPLTMRIKGGLVTGEIDVPYVVPFNGTIQSVTVLLQDTGNDDNDDLLVDVNINDTTIFAIAGDQPEILANTGTNQSVIVTADDMNVTTFSEGDIISLVIDTAPDESEDISCTLWVIPEETV